MGRESEDWCFADATVDFTGTGTDRNRAVYAGGGSAATADRAT
jgi:hypothetical protein